MQLNASRIKVLQAQDDLVNSMKAAAGKELLHVSHHHHTYKNLLKELIVQVIILRTSLLEMVFFLLIRSYGTFFNYVKLMNHWGCTRWKQCILLHRWCLNFFKEIWVMIILRYLFLMEWGALLFWLIDNSFMHLSSLENYFLLSSYLVYSIPKLSSWNAFFTSKRLLLRYIILYIMKMIYHYAKNVNNPMIYKKNLWFIIIKKRDLRSKFIIIKKRPGEV